LGRRRRQSAGDTIWMTAMTTFETPMITITSAIRHTRDARLRNRCTA
jgi:hypothetical protein